MHTLSTLLPEPSPWLADHLPRPFLERGPLDLAYWQWIAIPLALAIAWTLGALASRLTRAVVARIARSTDAVWDDLLVLRIAGPLTLAWSLLFCRALVPFVDLSARAEDTATKLLKLGIFFAFFWALFRSLDVAVGVITRSRWTEVHPASRSLVPLGGRIAKVGVFAIALIAILAELGYPVASLIAGLGIGGVALALAAQKTVENLFGAFSIGVDQPFREGDFVKVDDFMGTVEAIGLRSTRFRTLDRTLISLPNGKLAEMRVESFAPRDRIRFAGVVGLSYDTSAEQMRAVVSGMERVLREHPKVWNDGTAVHFKELAPSGLNVEFGAWFDTADFGAFQDIQQELLLAFMDVVKRAGTTFAVPVRAVHLVDHTRPARAE